MRENPPVTEPGVTYRVLGGDYALTDGDSGYIECYIRMNLSLIHILMKSVVSSPFSVSCVREPPATARRSSRARAAH